MNRISYGSRKELIHRLLRIRSLKSTPKCADAFSSAFLLRGFTSSTAFNSSSAMEPPKISNFADVEEVRETAEPEGE
jgi:hypothetical protein